MLKTKLRALLNGNRIEEVIDDDAPARASSDDAIALLAGLINLLTDGPATKARVAELAAATATARDAVRDADRLTKQSQADRASADDYVAKTRAAHDEKLANESASHSVALRGREQDVATREKNAAEAHDAALKLLDEARAAKVEAKNKLELMRRAAE